VAQVQPVVMFNQATVDRLLLCCSILHCRVGCMATDVSCTGPLHASWLDNKVASRACGSMTGRRLLAAMNFCTGPCSNMRLAPSVLCHNR